MLRMPIPVAQRWIDAFLAQPPTTECVIWPFSRDFKGYAKVWSKREKKMQNAHRVIWERRHGVVFPEPEARHTCGNGYLGCVNPEHIIPGTRQENVEDAIRDGRQLAVRRAKATLTPEDVVEICNMMRNGARAHQVAARFGVHEMHIGDIWRGDRWPEVDCPRLKDMERVCYECGAPLESTHGGKRYCNSTCRSNASRRKTRKATTEQSH
jgi:hypothetical protein